MKRKGIPKRIRFAVLRRDRFMCRYCGRGSASVSLEIDHIDSLANGGAEQDINNLITACFDCNRGKSSDSVMSAELHRKQEATEDDMEEKFQNEENVFDELPKWMLPRFNRMPNFTEGDLANATATTPMAFDYGQLAYIVFEQMQSAFCAEPIDSGGHF